jgi:hypothetical protein
VGIGLTLSYAIFSIDSGNAGTAGGGGFVVMVISLDDPKENFLEVKDACNQDSS